MMEDLQAIGKLMVLVVYHMLIFTTNVKMYVVLGGVVLYFLIHCNCLNCVWLSLCLVSSDQVISVKAFYFMRVWGRKIFKPRIMF